MGLKCVEQTGGLSSTSLGENRIQEVESHVTRGAA